MDFMGTMILVDFVTNPAMHTYRWRDRQTYFICIFLTLIYLHATSLMNLIFPLMPGNQFFNYHILMYYVKTQLPGEVYNARKGGRKQEEDEQQGGYSNNGYTVGRPGKPGWDRTS